MFIYFCRTHIDASLHNFQLKKRYHPYQNNTPIMHYELCIKPSHQDTKCSVSESTNLNFLYQQSKPLSHFKR